MINVVVCVIVNKHFFEPDIWVLNIELAKPQENFGV